MGQLLGDATLLTNPSGGSPIASHVWGIVLRGQIHDREAGSDTPIHHRPLLAHAIAVDPLGPPPNGPRGPKSGNRRSALKIHMTRGSPIHATHDSLAGPGKQPAVFPPFEISTTRRGDLYAIRIEGELDLSECVQLESALRAAEASLATRILLDLDELVFIDAAGLSVLVSAWRRSETDGNRLQVTCGEGSVANMLHLTALDTVLPFVDAGTSRRRSE